MFPAPFENYYNLMNLMNLMKLMNLMNLINLLVLFDHGVYRQCVAIILILYEF